MSFVWNLWEFDVAVFSSWWCFSQSHAHIAKSPRLVFRSALMFKPHLIILYSWMQFVPCYLYSRPDVILSGSMGSKHQLTNFYFYKYIQCQLCFRLFLCLLLLFFFCSSVLFNDTRCILLKVCVMLNCFRVVLCLIVSLLPSCVA